MNIINAPKSAIYLDFLPELPVGILNKKECGCGGTTYAITSKDAYIIAVPLTAIIDNKVASHPELMGISGNHKYSEESIHAHINSSPNPKFMVTYDSLPKLVSIMQKYGIDVYNDFKILADEYHSILTDYSYRGKALRGLISSVMQFKHYTFMSATPIPDEFKLDLFDGIPHTEIHWSAITKFKPVRVKTNKPYLYVRNIIDKFKANGNSLKLNGVATNELFFFINSVTQIKNIIDNCNLTQKDVKIVCDSNARNLNTLDGLEINKALDPNKPITFVTAKAFIGCDFFSATGLTFIVSNIRNKGTMLDVSTTISQIVNRNRDKSNPFKNVFVHVYNTAVADLSNEEWNAIITNNIKQSNTEINLFHKLTKEEKDVYLLRIKHELVDLYTYYDEDLDCLVYDSIKEQNQRFIFTITKDLYTNGVSIRDAYLKAGYDSTQEDFTKLDDTFFIKLATKSFKANVTQYLQTTSQSEREELEAIEPLLLDINKHGLTYSDITTLEFNKRLIKEYIFSNSSTVTNMVYKVITSTFQLNTFYSKADIKQMLQDIYTRNKVTKTAKANTLEDYFTVTTAQQGINGKRVNGFTLTSK